ncbi:Kinase, TTK [Giardia duodenalis]|uniref:Kinase, TTK n=1 Tax=Giardia intestinalis (strain ATCC 50803 / WB clone C6) TaxID=184922 RepID=A8BA50_GIAIC|nr:Kinase, TTK [Giardia intestinalis]KAE8303578.1 Kinase, TTK [Giardia intestinalis]|eukprot:XP_001708304.1 Kinase, TTK [Giardia lamblia ATCC 50803]
MFGAPGSVPKDGDPPADRGYRPMRGYFNWTRDIAKEVPTTPDATEGDQEESSSSLADTKACVTPVGQNEVRGVAHPPKPSHLQRQHSSVQHVVAPLKKEAENTVIKKSPIFLEEPPQKKLNYASYSTSSKRSSNDQSTKRSASPQTIDTAATKVLGLTQQMTILDNKEFQYNKTLGSTEVKSETKVVVATTPPSEVLTPLVPTSSTPQSAAVQKKPSQSLRKGIFGQTDINYNTTIDFQSGDAANTNIPLPPVTGQVLEKLPTKQVVYPCAPQVPDLQPVNTGSQQYRIPMVSLTSQNVTYTTSNQPTMAGESRAAITAPSTRQNSDGTVARVHDIDDPDYTKALKFLEKYMSSLALLFRKIPVQILYINKKVHLVIEQIGAGGYGHVYKALQPSGKLCAIKLLWSQKGNNYNEKEEKTNYKAMIDEIEIMKRLKGKGICLDLVDCQVVTKHNPFLRRYALIVMELGDTDLRSFMKEFKSVKRDRVVGPLHPCNLLPESKILSLLYDMITVLHRMHMQGYIHCDLKPQNFMFYKGRLRLIDFGISKAMQQDTTCAVTDTIAGTPKYMAPEIMLTIGRTMDNKKTELHRVADVWSIGCILFEMAAGYHPLDRYVDNHPLALLNTVAEKRYVIEADDLHVSPELRELILLCLEHSPKDRITMEGIFAHACLKNQFSQNEVSEFQRS